MNLKIITLSFAVVSTIYGNTLQDIQQSTLKNNQLLMTYDNNVDISNQNIKLATKWQNPILGFGVNDLLITDLTARDKEAMQTQFITFSQVIPTVSKLKYKQKINKIQSDILRAIKLDKNIELNSQIVSLLSKYTIIEDKIKLYKKLQNNIQDLKDLQNQRFKTTSIAQSDIIKSDTKVLQIDLKIQTLNNKTKTIKLKLQDISYTNISDINYHLMPYKIDNVDIDKLLQKNYIFRSLNLKVNKQTQNIKLQDAKKTADIKLNVGYYQRESFDDYVAFSVAYPLSIYGKENIEVLKAKQQKAKINREIKQFKNKFKVKLLTLIEDEKIAYQNYNTITSKIIPNKEYIQSLYISDSKNNQINTIKQIRLKNEILKDKIKSLDLLTNFYQAKSKILYFKGVQL